MQSYFNTDRLSLTPLTLVHDEFIMELVNTPGWLRFIGDRNIHNTDDAKAYINRVNENPSFTYWVAHRKDELKSIGVITFIKRDYLDFPDLGFAFLPDYIGAGYAFEAACVIKEYLLNKKKAKKLLATTMPENAASIKLLTKLGFDFQRQMEVNGDILLIYECQ